MKMLRNLALAIGALSVVAGVGNAAVIGYLSNIDTSAAYTLSLPRFNSALGTLTGVRLYFYMSETVTQYELKNPTGSTTTFDANGTANFTSLFSNSARAADNFNSVGTLVYFDTGTANSSFLGGCQDGGSPVPNNCNVQLSYAPGTDIDYASSIGTISNIDAAFTTGSNQFQGLTPAPFTVATGVQGLTGVSRAGSNILGSYVGASPFTLSGSVVNQNAYSGVFTGMTANLLSTISLQAEVDYTYTANAVPEPTTISLMGGSLLGAFLLRKRLKKS